jgi:type I restriction enzyme S subunit
MIADVKPYSEYKESELTWLGPVPKHWDTRPAFGAFVPNHERNRGMKEKTVLSLSYGRIVIKPTEKLHGLVPESFETYQIVNPGDIVIRPTDLQNDHTSLRVGMVRDRGIITSAYLALRVTRGVSPDFGFQFLNVWDTSKAIYGYGSGLRQNLDFSHFKRMPVAVPPVAEQAAIVRFLDWANGRLERAIRAKRKVIALLHEQKQAIIHRTVTRGLDPSVPLKHSGNPWLGDIPKHWEVLPSKALFKHRRDKALAEDEILTASQAHGVISREEFMAIEGRRVMQVITGSDILKHVEPNDFVMSMRSFQGGLEWSRARGAISSAYVMLVPTAAVHPPYFAHLLKSKAYVTALRRTSDLVRDGQALRYANFGQVPLLLVPLSEQRGIADSLDESVAAIAKTVFRLEREIELLCEYRTRLVADVVTGKLDVRDAAARLPEENASDSAEDLSGPSVDPEAVDEEAVI